VDERGKRQSFDGGFAPSFSAHVRWCEHGAPLWSCGDLRRLEGETCGIPHLAKNERDVGHPAIVTGIEPGATGLRLGATAVQVGASG
jgi:hypothetical protein